MEVDFTTNRDVRSPTWNGPLEVPDPGAATEMSTSQLTTVPLYNSEADLC
ncbi:hypothetical protein CDAR_619251, partial [Caerostris darwini]